MKSVAMLAIIICVISTGVIAQEKAADNNCRNYIAGTRTHYQKYYIDRLPGACTTQWLLPFLVSNRQNLKYISVVSIFGDHRDSFLKNHIHTAIDIIPSGGKKPADVFAMANGIVCSIHLGHPHRTVVIKHLLPDSTVIFTSYKHLAEIFVKTGDDVTPETKLGRLYTQAETKTLHGNFDHLHLEIRKSFDDYGCASWLTMQKSELLYYFFNPLEFLRKHLKNPS
ncbi:MAG: M23 family metallopeptidase [Ignavibacteria bacterium]|nr:M23 family metallopeptidase [Ignavibacteria bacterium]